MVSLNPTFVDIESPDSLELLERARAGDAEAFFEVCRAYETHLLRHAALLCGNATLAEDLAQETLVEAWYRWTWRRTWRRPPPSAEEWIAALDSGQPGSVWEAVVARLRGHWFDRRRALPALGATALVILAFSALTHRSHAPAPTGASVRTVSPPTRKADLPPTLSNYQVAAHQSLETLDELLTRQGLRSLPPAPVYTASTFAAANALE